MAEAREIAIGGERNYQYLESFKLGAIRLSNLHLSGTITGPVSQDQYRKVQQHVKDTIIHSVQKVRKQKPDIAYGSSGTIMNLAEIAHKAFHPEWNSRKRYSFLQRFGEGYQSPVFTSP